MKTPGGPHALEEDDVYNGYFIPAGTIVVPNQWCVYHHDVGVCSRGWC